MDYDTLYMLMGILQSACSGVWIDPTLPWPAIFIADFIQGQTTMAQFLEMMAHAGPEYSAMAECITQVK